MKDYATTDEVARLFETAPSVVRWWIVQGYLPHERIDRRYLIPRSALDGFVPPQKRSGRGRPNRHTVPAGWVTIVGAALYLGIPISTVRHRVLRGVYPSRTLPGGMRIVSRATLRDLDLTPV